VSGVGRVERFAGVKRVNYFDGQILGAQDFRDEQAYVIEKRRLLNRTLLGRGVVAGLLVSVPAGSSAILMVEPGLAIDNRGREIELRVAVSLDIPPAAGSPQYIIVEYTERETDAVALPTATPKTVASRIEEGAVMRFSDDDDAAGVAVGRIARSGSGWRVDHAFKPSRCRVT